MVMMQAARHEREHDTHCVVALLVESEVHLQGGSVTSTRQGGGVTNTPASHTAAATTSFHALHSLQQAA